MAKKAYDNFSRVTANVALAQQNGVSDDEIEAYLRTEGYTPERFIQAYENAQKAGGKTAEAGFGTTALNSLLFNFGDEALAALNAARGEGTYEQNLAAYNMALDEYARQNPGKALTAEVTGAALPVVATLGAGLVPRAGAAGLSTAARLAPAGARTIPMLARAKTAAKVGAVTGGLSGAGAAQPGQRTAGAISGAAIGTVVGPGSVVLLDKVGAPVARYVGGKVMSMLPGATARAATAEEQRVAQAAMDKFNAELDAAGVSRQDAYDLIAAAERAGAPNPRLPDVIRQLQALRNEAASQSGRAGQEALDAMRQRQKLQPEILAQQASYESGVPLTNVPLANQANYAAARAAADPVYEALRQRPNFTNNQLALMFQNRAGMREAFDAVKRNMSNEGYAFQSDYKTGVFNPNELNEIAKYMGDASAALSRQFDQPGAQPAKFALDSALEALDTQASKNIPEWAPVREFWRREASVRDARELGMGFLDAPPAEAADRLAKLQKLPPQSQQAFREAILGDFDMRMRQKSFEGLASADVAKQTLNAAQIQRLREGLGSNLEDFTKLAQELEKQSLSRQSLDKALLVKPETNIAMERVSGANIPRTAGGVSERLFQKVEAATGEQARQQEAARVRAEAERLTKMFNVSGSSEIGKMLRALSVNERQRLGGLAKQDRLTTAQAAGGGLLSTGQGADYSVSPDMAPEEVVLDAGNVYGRPPGMSDEEWNAVLQQRGLLSQ